MHVTNKRTKRASLLFTCKKDKVYGTILRLSRSRSVHFLASFAVLPPTSFLLHSVQATLRLPTAHQRTPLLVLDQSLVPGGGGGVLPQNTYTGMQIISSHLLFIQTSKTCQGKTCYRKLARLLRA